MNTLQVVRTILSSIMMFVAINVAGQEKRSITREELAQLETVISVPAGYPLTRDTFNRFKDHFIVKGKISSISGYYPQCGVVCTIETMIVKLSEISSDYPYSNLYVGFTCFSKIKATDVNEQLRLEVKKVSKTEQGCFWGETAGSIFDSKGLPFYELVKYTVE